MPHRRRFGLELLQRLGEHPILLRQRHFVEARDLIVDRFEPLHRPPRLLRLIVEVLIETERGSKPALAISMPWSAIASIQGLKRISGPPSAPMLPVAFLTGSMGADGGPLMRFKPWMLAIALQGMELAKAGFNPALGLDQHFYDQAKDAGRPVQGLETVE